MPYELYLFRIKKSEVPILKKLQIDALYKENLAVFVDALINVFVFVKLTINVLSLPAEKINCLTVR